MLFIGILGDAIRVTRTGAEEETEFLTLVEVDEEFQSPSRPIVISIE